MVAKWGLDFWAFSPALVPAPCLQGGNRARQAEAPGIPVTDTALPALLSGAFSPWSRAGYQRATEQTRAPCRHLPPESSPCPGWRAAHTCCVAEGAQETALGPTLAPRPALWDLEVCLREIPFRRSSGPPQASVAPCPDVLGPGIGQTGAGPASLSHHPTPGHKMPLPDSRWPGTVSLGAAAEPASARSQQSCRRFRSSCGDPVPSRQQWPQRS